MFKTVLGFIRRTNPPNPKLVEDKELEFGTETAAAVDAYLEIRGRQFGEHFHPVLSERLAMLLPVDPDAAAKVAGEEWLHYISAMCQLEELYAKEVPAAMIELFGMAGKGRVDPQLHEYLTQQIQATTRQTAPEAAVLIVTELERVRNSRGLPRMTFESGTSGQPDDLEGLRNAYDLADIALNAMRKTIRDNFDQRAENIRNAYLSFLQDRLGKIAELPPHSPAIVAEAEFDAFCGRIDEACADLSRQIHEQLADWFRLAELAGERTSFDDEIDAKTALLGDNLKAEGKSLLRESVRQSYDQVV